jgi:hypothetical protein
MEAILNWRAALRAFIAERIGQELIVGDLFDRFGANMPLHHATRMWCAGGNAKITDTTTPAAMRWRAFSQHIRELNTHFEPPLNAKSLLRPETIVIGETKACPTCGQEFFSRRGVRFCGHICGTRSKARRRAVRSRDSETMRDAQGRVIKWLRQPTHYWTVEDTPEAKPKPRRGRRSFPKTHCHVGHPYNEANTYHHKGRRYCRACMKIAKQRWDKKRTKRMAELRAQLRARQPEPVL